MSSFPNWVLMKSTKEEMLTGSVTSSWWKTTSEYPAALSLSTASLPLLTSRADNTTLTPFEANCWHIPYPIPLLAPVTTAILGGRLKLKIKKLKKEKKKKKKMHIRDISIDLSLMCQLQTLLFEDQITSLSQESCLFPPFVVKNWRVVCKRKCNRLTALQIMFYQKT